MKIFGRGQEKFDVSPTGHDKQLQRAIKIVLSKTKTNTIADQQSAEMVLDVLLEGSWDVNGGRQIRNADLTLEQNKEQILHKAGSIFELLDSSVPSNELRAALSSFVFNAGVVFGAPAVTVQTALDVMIESDNLLTYQTLVDTDSLFRGHLKLYIAELTPQEAKGFIAVFKRASLSVPQLAPAFDQLSEASEAQLVKSSKSGSRNAVSSSQRSTSKFCGNCGSPHDGAVKFCGSCGTPVST